MHAGLPAGIEQVARLFARLPGVGDRSAQRLALFVLGQEPDYAGALSKALGDLHESVGFCNECHHFAEGPRCSICADPHRDGSQLCVVEDVPDLLAIERSGEFRGVYHVLGGVLSPLKGVGPRDLRFDHLLLRLRELRPAEVIVATSVSIEGEATANYLQNLLRGLDLRLTRIASGVPQGSELEYLDQATLGRALRARLPFEHA